MYMLKVCAPRLDPGVLRRGVRPQLRDQLQGHVQDVQDLYPQGIDNPFNTYRYLSILLLLQLAANERGGSVINMSSVASSLRGLKNRFAYGASKAAVIGMTRSLAMDFVHEGVRVNVVLPGTVDTPSWRYNNNAPVIAKWLP